MLLLGSIFGVEHQPKSVETLETFKTMVQGNFKALIENLTSYKHNSKKLGVAHILCTFFLP